MKVFTTPATEEDSVSLAELIEEMESFYGATEIEPFDERLAHLREHLFGDQPSAWAIFARDGSGHIAGMAIYSFHWPAVHTSRSLFLKELYIRKPYQRQRVGQQLMKHLCEIAVAHECSRVEWTTDRDNIDAQRFYRALGFPIYEQKIFYRIDSAAFADTVRKLGDEIDS
ncbi:MAG: GNAT family N-acetyltransferase [Ktedonobacteraceae bacterium]|nr:GNAT family N-acetyltransferase [Ktedonobacteraceae bacterium]